MPSLFPPHERDELVRRFLPLVGHAVGRAASRLPPACVTRDDLVSAGLWGLVLAARSHEPQAATSFGAVATGRIAAAIAEDLRGRALSERSGTTRSEADRDRAAAQARHDLASVLRRRPTAAETTAAYGISVSAPPVRPVAEAGTALLGDLPPQLRAVMAAYYLRQRTTAEIAAELDLTEERVAQLRGEAVAMLRRGAALI